MNLRLAGQGAEGDPGAPKGNLLVQVLVEDDRYFIRDGYDVHTEIPIRVTQAILGGTVDVKTLDGTVEVKIPRGCQPDTKLMLRGKGIQVLHGAGKGNQIVHLNVKIPKEVSSEQEKLLRMFDDEEVSGGKGVAGRLAEAAGSAFEKFFGKSDKKKEDADKSDKNQNESNSRKENESDRIDLRRENKDEEDPTGENKNDEGDEEKKRTAQ